MTTRISRRKLLAGLAAAGAVAPLTRFGGGRRAHGAGAAGKAKVIFVYVPDGCIPDRWHPTGSETSFTLPEMTQPLDPIKGDLVFLKGLDMYGPGATHEGGVRKVLTANDPVSIDVFLGRTVNQVDGLPFDSLQLGVGANFQNGSGSMSFIGENVPVQPDDDPLNVYSRVFGGSTGDPGDESPRDRRRRAILGLADSDMSRLRDRLGGIDGDKLDIHVEAIRAVERRLGGATQGGSCNPGAFNPGGYTNIDTDYYPKTYEKEENFRTVGELQMDLAAMALSCKMTRVVSLMWSHPVSPTRIPETGSTLGNHDASHYGTPDSATATAFVSMKRWFMDRFVYLIEQLRQTADPDGGASLLESSVVVLCSELGDSNLHDHRQVPFVLAGQACGQLTTGRFLDYSGSASGDNQPHSKLLTSVANLMGVPVDRYGYTGHGTGPLPDL